MLGDAQIAVLCDIGQSIALGDDKQGDVDDLIRRGYAMREGRIYKLTPKGETALAERGAGLNEA